MGTLYQSLWDTIAHVLELIFILILIGMSDVVEWECEFLHTGEESEGAGRA